MIHNILVFSENGTTLYSWISSHSNMAQTNNSLLSSLFKGINDVLYDVFNENVQKVILEDRVLTISGRNVTSSENNENSNHLILVAVTSDKQDNSTLINEFTEKILSIISNEFQTDRTLSKRKKELDEEFTLLINKRIYIRSKNKLILSAISVFFSVFIISFISSIDLTFVLHTNVDSSYIFYFSIIFGFLLIVPSAGIAGDKRHSTYIGLIISFLASIFANYLIESNYFRPIVGSVGTPIVFVGIAVLMGLSCGLLGGLLMDRYFLFEEIGSSHD